MCPLRRSTPRTWSRAPSCSRVSPKNFSSARCCCSRDLPTTDHWRYATCRVKDTQIQGSLLDHSSSHSAGSCSRSSSSFRQETREFERKDRDGAAANAPPGCPCEKHELSSSD